MRKVKLRGLPKVDWLFVFASAAFNLIRLPKPLADARLTRARCLDTCVRETQEGHTSCLVDTFHSPISQL